MDDKEKLEAIDKLVRGPLTYPGLAWKADMLETEHGKSIDSLLGVLKDILKILEK